jgi:prepilin-type N-terminal cleavage/methylation domain-containing protein
MSGFNNRLFAKSSRGLTVVELMTAIALVAMLSTIAIPNIVAVLPKQRLGESAREILSILHFAKIAAIKENSNVVVNFNPGSSECMVFVDDGEGGGASEDGLRNGQERILKRYAMPSGVNLLSPSFGNVLSFNNRGFSDSTGDISVQNSRGTRQIRVLPSGHCKIL